MHVLDAGRIDARDRDTGRAGEEMSCLLTPIIAVRETRRQLETANLQGARAQLDHERIAPTPVVKRRQTEQSQLSGRGRIGIRKVTRGAGGLTKAARVGFGRLLAVESRRSGEGSTRQCCCAAKQEKGA